MVYTSNQLPPSSIEVRISFNSCKLAMPPHLTKICGVRKLLILNIYH